MISKLKRKFKSFFNKTKKWAPYHKWNSRDLRQKRVCENWSVLMLAEYYNINEYSMREVLDFYNIK